jgi:ABC-type polysaccharide/polyol phosphate export permease
MADLKSQVEGSYLGALWWILDPLLYMLVYSFIVKYVFRSEVERLSLFVFVGLTAWNFFSSSVQSSVNVIRSYRSVLLKNYIPKFALVVMTMIVNLVKMGIGLGISIVTVIASGIGIKPTLPCILPVLLVYMVITFGVSLICAHIGVYVSDFNNVVTVLLRLLFYLSGVFFTIDMIPARILRVYNYICPTGFLLEQFRGALMYGESASWSVLAYWFVFGMALSLFGLKLTYDHENTYMKVI